MTLRSFGSAALVGLFLLVAAPAAPAHASSASSSAAPSTSAASYPSGCRAGTPTTAPATTQFHDPARPFLGPESLPASRPVGPLLAGYSRFGQLTAERFLATYRGDDAWVYPPNDGFLVLQGQPIRYAQLLAVGQRVDRFGYPGGAYLAPVGTSFGQRALPPQQLNTPVGTPQSNYHRYCVLKLFQVDAGPAAPWFEQPGLGLQYKLETKYLPRAGTALSVTWLLRNGYLVEEKPARGYRVSDAAPTGCSASPSSMTVDRSC